MRILLLGKNGQVGWELSRSLLPLGELVALGRDDADLSRPTSLREVVQTVKPDIVINAAAYTAVDKAESEVQLATAVNSESVAILAEESKKCDALFVHYSTDYVFDGEKKSPYTEQDAPNPINTYGKTKLQGEDAIRTSGVQHLIFRTSWVYAVYGSNFAKKMIQLAREREGLRIVGDQFGAPTSAELIADITALCLFQIANHNISMVRATGTYNLAAMGETSWHGFAKYLISKAWDSGLQLSTRPDKVTPITTAEYPLPAMRPENSRLNTQKLCGMFHLKLPVWQTHAQRLVNELAHTLSC